MAQGGGHLGMFACVFGPLQARLLCSGQTIYFLELCPFVFLILRWQLFLDLLDSVSASIELTQTVKQDLFLSSPPASSRNTAHTRLAGAVALTIHFAVQSGVATDAHVCPCDRA